MGEYINFLLNLETPEKVKELQKNTLEIEDELKIFRERYVKKIRPITEKAFLRFATSPEFQKFKKENKDALDIF